MKYVPVVGLLVLGLSPLPSLAEPVNAIAVGAILDGFYKCKNSALSEAEKGFALGHTELSFSGAVDDLFNAQLTPVLHQHEGETEVEVEEAYLQTSSLPGGLLVRAGRFLSQVGYLNGRHTHEDSFAERPAAYRAFFGSHYFDDGVRLTLVFPTPFYWSLGAEAFNGAQLSGEPHELDSGIYSFASKWGGDIGDAHSWQVGLSYMKNRMTGLEHEEEEEAEEEEGHAHTHAAGYMAEHFYMADAVWKWAPNGNAKDKQVVLSTEYMEGKDITPYAESGDKHTGWYASAVFRFAPQWAVGARYGEVELWEAHEDHFHEQTLEESDYSIIWSRSHFSSLKLSYTHQTAAGFDEVNDTVTLQYNLALGAHGAHSF